MGHSRISRRITAIVPAAGALALGLVLAACSSSPSPSASSPTTHTGGTASASSHSNTGGTGSSAGANSNATVATTHTSRYGTILVDSSGQTLYMLSSDPMGSSTCAGACASIWPPLTVGGTATAGSGVNSSMLTTIDRSDGSHQVAYNGHPLYTYASDSGPGQTYGQGIVSFGGTWYVVNTAGQAVTSSTAAATTTTSGAGGGGGYGSGY